VRFRRPGAGRLRGTAAQGTSVGVVGTIMHQRCTAGRPGRGPARAEPVKDRGPPRGRTGGPEDAGRAPPP